LGCADDALAANHDLQIAGTRIPQAEAQMTVARSQLFPTINADGATPYARFTGSQGNRPPMVLREVFAPPWRHQHLLGVGLLGSAAARDGIGRGRPAGYRGSPTGVETTLVAQVAQAYFDLRALDAVLEISRGERLASDRVWQHVLRSEERTCNKA